MTLATTDRGHQLLRFARSDTPQPPENEREIPIPFALVVATYQGKTLLVYNPWREAWELPGGMIDDGETPVQAAIRELQEETAQLAPELDFIGLAKMQLKPDDRLEFGAIFACELESLQPFQPNEEANAIFWWDAETALEGVFNAIDRRIIEMTHQYQAASR